MFTHHLNSVAHWDCVSTTVNFSLCDCWKAGTDLKRKQKKKTLSLFLDLQQKDRVAHINTANWPKTHAAVKHLKQLKTAHYMNPRCGVSRTIPLHSMCNCLVLVQFVSVQYVLWISVSCWHVCSRVLPVQNRSHYCRLTQSVSASAS